MKSRKYEEFFFLPTDTQAWLVAYFETEQLLEMVMGYVANKGKEGGSE